MSSNRQKKTRDGALYQRVREILESARSGVARTVNTTQVIANWLIGREIVEEEQSGSQRAAYGDELIRDLATQLTREFGKGYSPDNLFWFRRFYREYPKLLSGTIFDAPRQISNQRRLEWKITQSAQQEAWQPGRLNSRLSWTHYRTFLRVDKPESRAFYEIEAIQNNWAARELERQINSLLYERLALSRDKKGLLRLARKGQEIQGPLDVFKDPLVLEFLKIPASARLVESDLEAALLNELQGFLLELGKGFAFVARQQRITLDGDHFYSNSICRRKQN